MNTTFDSRFSPGLPFALRLAVEHHVDALEDEALRVVLERDDALAAQDVRPSLLRQPVDPRHELVGIDVALEPRRDRLHVFVVVVLQAVIAMMMAVMVVIVMVVIVDGEELRLDVEDAVEIEGAPLQHLGDRDVAVLRAMKLGVGVDRADARLDLAQFRRR